MRIPLPVLKGCPTCVVVQHGKDEDSSAGSKVFYISVRSGRLEYGKPVSPKSPSGTA